MDVFEAIFSDKIISEGNVTCRDLIKNRKLLCQLYDKKRSMVYKIRVSKDKS